MSASQRRHLRVVLTVTPLFWACVAVWNVFNTYLFIKIGQNATYWADPGERVLQHVFMLPLLMMAYFAAAEIRARSLNRPKAWGLQLLLAVLFSFSYRPALQLAYGIGHHESWPVMLHYLRILAVSPWAEAVSEFIWCFLLYVFGLFLMLNILTYQQLRDAEARADDLQIRWLSAHLEVLRGQLNPHFLFNSLNTVASLVLTKPEKANRLVVELSELLRSMLEERRSEYVSVREELNYIRRYLSVEQTRFEDRLQAVIEADAGALEVRIPAFILQPVVENAIKHGIAKTRGQGELRIAAENSGGRLLMLVSNTSAPEDSELAPGHGIGLRNVRARLTAIYQDGYDLVTGWDGAGMWTTRITLPVLLPADPSKSGS